jgi:hypothetical protein
MCNLLKKPNMKKRNLFAELTEGFGALAQEREQLHLSRTVCAEYEAVLQRGQLALSQDRNSMNQFIASAVAEKISALATETYLQERAARGSQAAFNAALQTVPATPPDKFDAI